MAQEKNIYRIEFTAIILLWTLAIVSPLLFMDNYDHNWKAVHVMWTECAVVGFAFLINRLFLMPRLFFRKKYAAYAAALAGLFVLMGTFILYADGVNMILSIFGEGESSVAAMRPPRMEEGMPLHQTQAHRPPHGMGGPAQHLNDAPPINTLLPPSITVLILTAIVIALDMGVSIAIKWIISEQRQTESERERVSTQLSNLQSQISPHFFMNTLNNIHALVEIDPERAQKTIIELSGLMDYLLYSSSNKQTISLPQEMEFTKSYINLMRLRYPDRVAIEFRCDENIPTHKIPPLLFLNFIENTFKYGVDYSQPSFINIHFRFTADYIEMETINSNHSTTVKAQRHGLGISNSRKRLKLLYDDKFKLEITDHKEVYCVNLKIPII
ncbi:MAG: sensor histidine kinase [Rikenellaceae bacterium]